MALYYFQSSTTAATLIRRCASTAVARRCARLPSSGSLPCPRLAAPSAPNAFANSCTSHVRRDALRSFSQAPPPPATAPPPPGADANANAIQPPTTITPDAGLAAQDAMRLVVEHGVGRQKLERIAADRDVQPFVQRWQRTIHAYLEAQCHVLGLLGYPADERGIGSYTQQLTEALRLAPPDAQERLRVAGRDTYRIVLSKAFGIPSLVEGTNAEVGVVDARNMMHKVSQRMQDPAVLEKVAKVCATSVAMNDSPEAKALEFQHKHVAVQNVMVEDVYLATGEDGRSLVEELGFGEGEGGYVRLQSAMAEHQGDPLIGQYIGAAMGQLLRSAGIEVPPPQAGAP